MNAPVPESIGNKEEGQTVEGMFAWSDVFQLLIGVVVGVFMMVSLYQAAVMPHQPEQRIGRLVLHETYLHLNK